jgi:hypothetical protein
VYLRVLDGLRTNNSCNGRHNFLPEINLIDFRSEKFDKLECVNKILISPSVCVPVDASVEMAKTDIWG